MATIPSHASVQEMPPPGGFGKVNFKASVPKSRGPPGWFVFSALGFMTVYGFYQIGQTNIERRRLKKEKRELRIALLPFLQAEEDVIFLRKQSELHKDEAETMNQVPGWVVGESTFHSKRWAAPR